MRLFQLKMLWSELEKGIPFLAGAMQHTNGLLIVEGLTLPLLHRDSWP